MLSAASSSDSSFPTRVIKYHQVIHGDLSARNILLTCDWTAKICNFGIAQRPKFQDESYAKQIPKVNCITSKRSDRQYFSRNYTHKCLIGNKRFDD